MARRSRLRVRLNAAVDESRAACDGADEPQRATHGVVYLVGAGPGAPDLLTLRAARLLAQADIVFHDALVHPETLALAARAEIVAVGKRCGARMRAVGPAQDSNSAPSGASAAAKPQAWADPSTAQRFINRRLVEAVRHHRVVVRLKGGDPMLFGRAQEEIDALEAAGVPFEIVPGITAALAASADIATSLTQRGRVRTFTLATPRRGEGERENGWADAFRDADAGAIYMGLSRAADIAASLIAGGQDPATPVAIVIDASLPSVQVRYTTIAGLAHGAPGTRGPALLFIGPQFHARALREHAARSREPLARAV